MLDLPPPRFASVPRSLRPDRAGWMSGSWSRGPDADPNPSLRNCCCGGLGVGVSCQ
uniref:Uncharacterized protein n=1 Tax=Arundo donax TaxID=35708 RepID=A0A0A9E0J7_ARUDO